MNPSRTQGSARPAAAIDTIAPIGELVPHTGTALLLEAVVEADQNYVRCAATVQPDSPFVRDGVLDAIVLVEFMAQAVAAFAGLSARRAGRAQRIGFLVGCREASFACERLPVGARLMVGARRVSGEREIGRFQCEVSHEGLLVDNASLSVAYADEM